MERRKSDGPGALAGASEAGVFDKSGQHDSSAAAPAAQGLSLVAELRALARAVRRIGTARRETPESIALAKEAVSARLVVLAAALERGAA